MKFTQEIKDNWLTALRSGNFTQGYSTLQYISKDGSQRFCCIGVLGEVTEGLEPKAINSNTCPYNFLVDNIGKEKMEQLYLINDRGETIGYKDDYSNVIPFIETFKVSE